MHAKGYWRTLPWLLALLMVAAQTQAVVHALSHVDLNAAYTLHHDHDHDHKQQHAPHNHAGASHSDLACKLCAAGHATLPVVTLPLIPQHAAHTWRAPPDVTGHTSPREQYLCRDPPRAG